MGRPRMDAVREQIAVDMLGMADDAGMLPQGTLLVMSRRYACSRDLAGMVQRELGFRTRHGRLRGLRIRHADQIEETIQEATVERDGQRYIAWGAATAIARKYGCCVDTAARVIKQMGIRYGPRPRRG